MRILSWCSPKVSIVTAALKGHGFIQVRYLALQIDLKGRTDYITHSWSGFLQSQVSSLWRPRMWEHEQSRLPPKQRSTQCSDHVFWDCLTRRKGQQQFSAGGWQSSMLCSRQKCEPLKRARGPGKDTARDSSGWFGSVVQRITPAAAHGFWQVLNSPKSKLLWFIVPTREIS